MKKEYLVPDLKIVEIRCDSLMGVSGVAVTIQPGHPDYFSHPGQPTIPGMDIGYGGIDSDGSLVPM